VPNLKTGQQISEPGFCAFRRPNSL